MHRGRSGKGLRADLDKQRRIERLRKIMPHAQGECLVTNPGVRVGSHHHNGHMIVPSPKFAEHLHAVHDGHVHVQQHAPDRSLLHLKGHQCQARPAVVSDKDGVAYGLESVFQGFAERGIVIDDQNPSFHISRLPKPAMVSPFPRYRWNLPDEE